MLGLEVVVFNSVCPFAGGSFSDLHEAVFAGGTPGVRIEAAFAPDDGLNDSGVDFVGSGGLADFGVEGSLKALSAPPQKNAGVEHDERQ